MPEPVICATATTPGERSAPLFGDAAHARAGICWHAHGTVGHAAIVDAAVLGEAPADYGVDAQLGCDLVRAGKFRNGAARWWCRSHLTYWGVQADLAALARAAPGGAVNCALHATPVNYLTRPFTIDLSRHAEVGIWYAPPAALSNRPVTGASAAIHVRARRSARGPLSIDHDFPAVSVRYPKPGQAGAFTLADITAPAALAFARALEHGLPMDCVNCARCGEPHLDLGEFSIAAHQRHYCGNCGFDGTHSKGRIISTPLQPLHARHGARQAPMPAPMPLLDLDHYGDVHFQAWPSQAPIVWTMRQPPVQGIHVRIEQDGRTVVDAMVAALQWRGTRMTRADLLAW